MTPSVLWQYLVDPAKRLKWQTVQTAIDDRANSDGRLGVGATSHCAHGGDYDLLRRYLDWRPFSYFTCSAEPTKRSFANPRSFLYASSTETTEFLPTDDGGTVVHYRMRYKNRGRLFLLMRSPLVAFTGPRTASALGASLRRILEDDGWLKSVEENAAVE